MSETTSNETRTNNETDGAPDYAAELAAATVGCVVGFNWFGAERTLNKSQTELAASAFGAEQSALKATKRLIPTDCQEFRAVERVKRAIRAYRDAETLPYVEPGIYLIRRENVERFGLRIEEYRAELASKVTALQSVYLELKARAARELGTLYNPADYPETLADCFHVHYRFPELTPPSYLSRLAPEVYTRESARVRESFAQSVAMAETAFTTELAKMVEHIASTLAGTVDGKPRTFKNSLVGNLQTFFDRFSALNIGSNAELDSLVAAAKNAVSGIKPQQLRDDNQLRATVAASFADIGQQIEAAATLQPARRLQLSQEQPAAELDSGTEPAAVDGNGRRLVLTQPAAASDSETEPEPTAEQPEPETEPQPEPVAVPSVRAAALACFGFGASSTPPPAVAEPETEPETEPEPTAEQPDPQPEPAAELDSDDETETEPEPAGGIAFNINYGGGNVRRLVLPSLE